MGDGNMLIVPNSELVNTKILNLSMPSRETTASASFRVPADTPFARIREICLDVIAQVEKANASRGKWVNLAGIQDGALIINAGFWLREMDDSGAALTDFYDKLVARFRKENISFHAASASFATSSSKS
jgi:small-conductance mechanosensitive channel